MYSEYDLLAEGLPHSDIFGSKPARGSPKLFAACHVLHRLLVPRHPPNALLSFNTNPITQTSSNETGLSLPAMHRNHSSESITIIETAQKTLPLGTEKSPNNPDKNPEKLRHAWTRISCNIHGHHNRNHRIIIHLNTRKLPQLWLVARTTPQVRQPIAKAPDPLSPTLGHQCPRIRKTQIRASRRTKTYSP
jgi:hypothetical protein